MEAFFAGLAVVFALLLFGKGRGKGLPGILPRGISGPGAPFAPSQSGPLTGPQNLPSGPTGSCNCGSATNYTRPPAANTTYGNVQPSAPVAGTFVYSIAGAQPIAAPGSSTTAPTTSFRPSLGTTQSPDLSGATLY